MLTPERHQLILQIIKEKPIVKIQELVDLTEASESTIRRDLTILEEGKFLKRVHGGAARLRGKLQEPSMIEKSTKYLQEKRQIAQYAASLVEEGDSIYLDAGSTILEMVSFLPVKDIVVVTNGLMHLPQLLERNIETYVIGGYAKPKTNAIIGRGVWLALNSTASINASSALMEYILTLGIQPPDQEEALIKQKAMTLSRETFVLADDTKFSEITFAKIADLHEAAIITNTIDEDHKGQYTSKTSIKVVTS